MTSKSTKTSQVQELSDKEVWTYFDGMVQKHLGCTGKAFLKNPKAYRSNPHYESVMFLKPLAYKLNGAATNGKKK